MRVYETTVIVNPQVDDATIDRQVKDIAELITKSEGKILLEDRMGTRRLAYPIDGLTQGYYASFIYEAPIGVPALLDRHFGLNEPYIRHLTVLFDGDLKKVLEQHAALQPTRREPRLAGSPRAASSTDESTKQTAPTTEVKSERPEPAPPELESESAPATAAGSEKEPLDQEPAEPESELAGPTAPEEPPQLEEAVEPQKDVGPLPEPGVDEEEEL